MTSSRDPRHDMPTNAVSRTALESTPAVSTRLSDASEQATIGLIGIGLVGTALATRWLAAGLRVVGFDLSAERRAAFQRIGGEPAESATDVLLRCRTTVLSLPDSMVVGQVLDDAKQTLSRSRGRLIIDTTTGDPVDSQRQADRLRSLGAGFVDATLVGSSRQIADGQAIALVGGAAEHLPAAQAILQLVAARAFHVGPAGAGARMKLVVNLVLGLHRAVLAEGLALAESAGFDPSQVLEILQASPAASRVMDTKGQLMLQHDFRPQARLAQHRKDVELIRELGSRHGQGLPLTAAHAELLDAALRLNYGDQDNSAIVQVYREALRTPNRDNAPND